jgi:ATP-dependent DNA helicase RecG
VVTLWRDWLTEEVLTGFHLNDRQLTGLAGLRLEGRLTSGMYQEQAGVSRQTATRDLEDMVKKGILERRGKRRGAFYIKAKVMPQL